MTKWQRNLYLPNIPLGEDGRKVTGSAAHLTLSKEAAKEGMVLLKNNGNLLPLAKGTKVALFGKASVDYVKSGGGSGDVVVDHTTNLIDGLCEDGSLAIYEPLARFYRAYVEEQRKSYDPGLVEEPELAEEEYTAAALAADVAVISISRFSGEGWDRKSSYDAGLANGDEITGVGCLERCTELFRRGDFYLSDREAAMIDSVQKKFDKVVVILNVGGVVDSSWFAKAENIDSVLVIWNAGEEGGLAAAEVLAGKGYPSGKLPDTFAETIEAYPSTKGFHESEEYVDYKEDIYVGYRYFETVPGAYDKVVYPFGYGLGYTDFAWETTGYEYTDAELKLRVKVTNTGKRPGKETIQIYVNAPQGRLGKAKKSLVAFRKTEELKPQESADLDFTIPVYAFASYDDLGKICKAAYVLEAGEYEIYVGNSVRNCTALPENYRLEHDAIVKQLATKCSPTSLSERMLADGSYEALPQGTPNDPRSSEIDWEIIASAAGKGPDVRFQPGRDLFRHPYGEDAILLSQVAEGSASLSDFIKGMKEEDLLALLGGQENIGVGVTNGIGNQKLYGIPNVMTADGPAGLRVNPEMGVYTTCWPCATALAATFNTELVGQVGAAAAREIKENNIAVWLAPAVNIHRSPLCGRNFEYYSEDPVLAGKIGAAMVRGVQSQHIGATIKHFACNNKETNRINSDSRLSERALREIYLKQFEIIVKEAGPWCVMTSYNILNGHRTSENKDLLTDILRGEWGYDGMVMTDWWCQGNHYKEVKAGNDLKMPVGYPENLKLALEAGVLSREELERCAEHILSMICKLD